VIRKILLCIVLIYTAAWFAIAYTLKGNVVGLVKRSETDNIKVTYTKVDVSGFPARWHIKLIEPKIQFISGVYSREFSSSVMTFIVYPSFKKASLSFGKEIKRQEVFHDQSTEYYMRSVEDIECLIKLNKPFYKLSNNDTVQSVTKSLQFDNKSLLVAHQDKELYNIDDVALLINRIITTGNEDIVLQLRFLYTGQEKFLNFKKAKLDLATVTSIATTQNNKDLIIKNFNVNHLNLVCDDNAVLEMVGSVKFSSNRLPLGKLSFELVNYHDVVDKLMPHNLVFPKKMVKSLIEKAVNSNASEAVKTDDGEISTYEKIKFDVEFSETGINVGAINLLELNVQNSKDEGN
jgi:hypothetical protein